MCVCTGKWRCSRVARSRPAPSRATTWEGSSGPRWCRLSAKAAGCWQDGTRAPSRARLRSWTAELRSGTRRQKEEAPMSRKTEVALRDRGAVSGLLTGLSFVAGVGGGSALADSPYPRPGSEPAEVRRYFTENVRSARLSATGQLVSSASLARFTASVARLAGRSGKGSEGLRKAALVGGALAAALALAGLRTGELPRPVAIAGLASAASGLLSPLYFLDERAD